MLAANAPLMFALIIFTGALVSLLCLMAAFSGGGNRRVKRRIERASGMVSARAAATKAGSHIRIAEPTGPFAGLERLAARLLPNTQSLRARLGRTGRKITVGRYIGICLAVGFVGTALASGMGLALPLAFAIGVAAGIILPHLVVGLLAQRQAKQFMALFPDAIDLIVRGLRSGLPVTEQLGAVGAELADPVGLEFRNIAQAVRFGQTLDEALWEAADRLGITDFKFFVVSLAVQRETGGNLAETLQNLSDVLRRRRQMRLKVKAMASEASASALILGSLPFLMLGILMLLNFDYMIILFSDPRGQVMAGGALLLQVVGVFIMSKMVRFDI